MNRSLLLHGGLLALDPRALQMLLGELPEVDRSNVVTDGAVIVRVQGPLEHHRSATCDSYEDILARVGEACASDRQTVILAVDSPGGLVGGCFEARKMIRARVAEAGKTLIAYVSGQASSAGYALACAADRIVAAETALVGSIGVLDVRVDVSAMDAAMGVQFAFITSGARKADGNPHTAWSADELADRQRVVDTLTGVFFATVADARRVPVDALARLEARVFSGQAALAAGLVDSIATMDELLASAGAEGTMTPEEEARAALQRTAEGDDEKAAARARRALAAMDESEEPAAEGDDESEEPAAEGDDEEDEPSGASASAATASAASSTVSAQTAGDIAAQVATQGRQISALTAQLQASERAALLGNRKDIPKELRKILATKPVAEVKAILGALPKAASAPAASATPAATRGKAQNGQAPALAPEQKARLDETMGLTSSKLGVVSEPHKLILGTLVPASGKDVSHG